MKKLKPQKLETSYFEGIEKEIAVFFREILFKPLFMAVQDLGISEKQNSNDPLSEAILSGKVTFEGGVFTGQFNAKLLAALSRLGAKYSKKAGGWVLADAPPVSVSIAVAQYADKINKTSQRLLAVLDGIDVQKAIETAAIRHSLGLSLDRMDQDWQKTVQSIGIVPKLTTYQKAELTENWGKNLELYIKNWSDEKIIELRENIQPHALKGGRSSKFARKIQKDYKVSKSKAKFLARQETSLLLSKMKQARYEEAGLQKYQWSTSGDARTREDHKALDGKIIDWANPPVVDKKTGRRAHAGEDFNCRCVAIPIIE